MLKFSQVIASITMGAGTAWVALAYIVNAHAVDGSFDFLFNRIVIIVAG